MARKKRQTWNRQHSVYMVLLVSCRWCYCSSCPSRTKGCWESVWKRMEEDCLESSCRDVGEGGHPQWPPENCNEVFWSLQQCKFFFFFSVTTLMILQLAKGKLSRCEGDPWRIRVWVGWRHNDLCRDGWGLGHVYPGMGVFSWIFFGLADFNRVLRPIERLHTGGTLRSPFTMRCLISLMVLLPRVLALSMLAKHLSLVVHRPLLIKRRNPMIQLRNLSVVSHLPFLLHRLVAC